MGTTHQLHVILLLAAPNSSLRKHAFNTNTTHAAHWLSVKKVGESIKTTCAAGWADQAISNSRTDIIQFGSMLTSAGVHINREVELIVGRIEILRQASLGSF